MPGDRDRDRGRSRDREGRRAVDPLEAMTEMMSTWAQASTLMQQQNPNLLHRMSENALMTRRREGRSVPHLSFDGTRSWPVFLAQFESVAQDPANLWDEEEKGRRLLQALHGQAADLVQTLPRGDYLNFNALSERLRAHFDPAQRGMVAEAQLDRRVQQPNESVQDFGAEILRLARLAYPTWPEVALQTTARKAFIAGLANNDVRRQVRLQRAETFADALTAALHVQAVENHEAPPSKRPRLHQVSQVVASDGGVITTSETPAGDSAGASSSAIEVRRVDSTDATAQRMQELVKQLEGLVKSFAAGSARPRAQGAGDGPRCYECDSPDHFARDCPRRQQRGRGRQDRRGGNNGHRDSDSRHRRRDGRGSNGRDGNAGSGNAR